MKEINESGLECIGRGEGISLDSVLLVVLHAQVDGVVFPIVESDYIYRR